MISGRAGVGAIAVVGLLAGGACSAHATPHPGIVDGSIEQCTSPGTKPLNSPGLAAIDVYQAAHLKAPIAAVQVQTTATERDFHLTLPAGSYRIGVASSPTVTVVVRPGETTHSVMLPFICSKSARTSNRP